MRQQQDRLGHAEKDGTASSRMCACICVCVQPLGFEIAICVTDATIVPELGKFKRWATDVVVNSAWLTFWCAKTEKSAAAAAALKNHILDGPMDFVRIEGSTAAERDENKFKWAVHMSAKVERLRNFVGLENANLLRIVATAAECVKSTVVNGKKTAERVRAWLVENVNWGALQGPDVPTQQRHMCNWAALAKNKEVWELMESALQRWGRDSLFERPTNVQVIVQKRLYQP